MVYGQNTFLICCHDPSRSLRWSETGLVTVPRVKTKHRGAAFSFYATHIKIYNMRSAPTVSVKSRSLHSIQLNLGLYISFLHCTVAVVLFLYRYILFYLVSVFLKSYLCASVYVVSELPFCWTVLYK